MGSGSRAHGDAHPPCRARRPSRRASSGSPHHLRVSLRRPLVASGEVLARARLRRRQPHGRHDGLVLRGPALRKRRWGPQHRIGTESSPIFEHHNLMRRSSWCDSPNSSRPLFAPRQVSYAGARLTGGSLSRSSLISSAASSLATTKHRKKSSRDVRAYPAR